MLTEDIRRKSVLRRSCVLLLFISCITFQTIVSAEIKEQSAEKYRRLGYAEKQKGNLDEALSYYIKATSLGFENAALLNDMGVLYEEINFISKAIHFYSRAIQTDQNYLPAYINLAYVYQRLGKNEQAAWYFKKRYELGDKLDPWAQKAKEELIKIKPEYKSWVKSIEADSLNNDLVAKSQDEFYRRIERSQQHYLKGEEFYKKGQYKDALEEYNTAWRLAPRNPKINDARNSAIIKITKEQIEVQTKQAIKMLEAGDTLSARHEIQRILTIIPKEPILISR